MPHGTGIFTYIWLKLMGFHVGKYTVRPMEPMGKCSKEVWGENFRGDFQGNLLVGSIIVLHGRPPNLFRWVRLRPVLQMPKTTSLPLNIGPLINRM